MMTRLELEELLKTNGIPAEQATGMAAHLEKRATDLSDKKGLSYEQSLNHLIHLMKQGWAAKKNRSHES